METMLWVVLIVALVLAAGFALFAWRVLRRNHERTEARAALLRQMTFEPETPFVAEAPADEVVTYEPRRAVRPAPAPHDVLRAAPAADLLRAAPSRDLLREPATVVAWEPAPPPSAPPRRWMPVIVVLLFLAVGASAIYGGLLQSGTVEAAPTAQTLPLDLLSLSHRIESGDLIVTGLVQNPRDGRPAPRVMAVVYVFDSKGEYTASAKAALDFAPLAPGAESPFAVRIPKIAGVSRFRIGFRGEDGSVVAHVDRRGQPIEGTTAGPALNGEGR
jgi:HAMP domain-containing protein